MAGIQPPLTMVRFGRFAAVLGLTRAPTHPVHEGLWAFGRGMAHLRTGSRDSAAAYLARVDSLAVHTPRTRTFRQHEPARLLGVVSGILRGEMLRAAGRTEDAVRAYREAATLEAGLAYDEPEPLPIMTSDYLGAALLEAGRADEAVVVYEAALVARPNNGWSLAGLERALRAAGRAGDADAAHVRFERAWVRSGMEVRGSRF